MVPEATPVTDDCLDLFASRVRAFRAVGGMVRRPPHDSDQLALWQNEVADYRERFLRSGTADQYPRVRDGLELMCTALHRPLCLLALRNEECHGVLSYAIRRDGDVWVGRVGSKQRSDTPGAGVALEYEIAQMAAELDVAVNGMYLEDARTWHQQLCRRLDVGLARFTSTWTREDCKRLRDGIRDRLG